MKRKIEPRRAGDERTAPALVAGGAAGLIGGLVASWLMVQFQQRIWPPPEGDGASATAKLARQLAALGGRDLTDEQAATGGELIHYTLGAGLGLAYGAAAAVRPGVAADMGVRFGVATEAVIDQAIVPALGLANPFWKCPAEWHLRGLAAHIVFGVATETTRRLALELLDPAEPA